MDALAGLLLDGPGRCGHGGVMAGSRKKAGLEVREGGDFAELQRKLTRAMIFEIRENLDDLLPGQRLFWLPPE